MHSNEIYTDTTPYDRNYLHALHAFDLGDFAGTATHLEGVGISLALQRVVIYLNFWRSLYLDDLGGDIFTI